MRTFLSVLFVILTACSSTANAGYGDAIGCQALCCPYQTFCQCADPGFKWNNCISPCTYCEAFGNIGAR